MKNRKRMEQILVVVTALIVISMIGSLFAFAIVN